MLPIIGSEDIGKVMTFCFHESYKSVLTLYMIGHAYGSHLVIQSYGF